MVEFQLGGMLESYWDQVINRLDQQGTWSGPGGGP